MKCAHLDLENKPDCPRQGLFQMTGLFTCPLHMDWTPPPPPPPKVTPQAAPHTALPVGVDPASRAAALEVLHSAVGRFLAGRAGVLDIAAAHAACDEPRVDAPAIVAEAAARSAVASVATPAAAAAPEPAAKPAS